MAESFTERQGSDMRNVYDLEYIENKVKDEINAQLKEGKKYPITRVIILSPSEETFGAITKLLAKEYSIISKVQKKYSWLAPILNNYIHVYNTSSIDREEKAYNIANVFKYYKNAVIMLYNYGQKIMNFNDYDKRDGSLSILAPNPHEAIKTNLKKHELIDAIAKHIDTYLDKLIPYRNHTILYRCLFDGSNSKSKFTIEKPKNYTDKECKCNIIRNVMTQFKLDYCRAVVKNIHIKYGDMMFKYIHKYSHYDRDNNQNIADLVKYCEVTKNSSTVPSVQIANEYYSGLTNYISEIITKMNKDMKDSILSVIEDNKYVILLLLTQAFEGIFMTEIYNYIIPHIIKDNQKKLKNQKYDKHVENAESFNEYRYDRFITREPSLLIDLNNLTIYIPVANKPHKINLDNNANNTNKFLEIEGTRYTWHCYVIYLNSAKLSKTTCGDMTNSGTNSGAESNTQSNQLIDNKYVKYMSMSLIGPNQDTRTIPQDIDIKNYDNNPEEYKNKYSIDKIVDTYFKGDGIEDLYAQNINNNTLQTAAGLSSKTHRRKKQGTITKHNTHKGARSTKKRKRKNTRK